jgi:hypothetical protein
LPFVVKLVAVAELKAVLQCGIDRFGVTAAAAAWDVGALGSMKVERGEKGVGCPST